MPFKGKHAARIKNPGVFDRIRIEADGFGAGIDVAWGMREGSDEPEVQSLRFDASRFTLDEAKKWLEDHGYPNPLELEEAAAEEPAAAASQGGRPRPLVKELAFPGTFTDALGRRVTFSPELLRQAVEGTQTIQGLGFQVRGYSSHFTDDSSDVMGKWPSVYLDHRGHPFGIFQPMTEADRDRALELDASVFLEKDVEVGGITVPYAFTRIDIVGQGAIVGTDKFREAFSRYIDRRKLVGAFSTGGVVAAAPQLKETEMRALGMAMGLEDQTTKTLLDNLFVKNVLGLQESATDEQILEAMTNVAEKGAQAPEEPAEGDAAMGEGSEEEKTAYEAAMGDDAPPADEPPAEPEEKKEEPAAAGVEAVVNEELASALATIAEMQEEKVAGLFSASSLGDEDKAAVLSLYRKLRKGSGHEAAFEAAESKVAMLSKAVPGASEPKKTRVVPRKAAKNTHALLGYSPRASYQEKLAAMSVNSPTLDAYERAYGKKGAALPRKNQAED